MRSLASKAARTLNARRRIHAGGRPKKLKPCPYCGRQFGAREMRKHLPTHRRS